VVLLTSSNAFFFLLLMIPDRFFLVCFLCARVCVCVCVFYFLKFGLFLSDFLFPDRICCDVGDSGSDFLAMFVIPIGLFVILMILAWVVS